MPSARALVKRFRYRCQPAAARESTVPPGHLVYAIGDIHGRADLLLDLHEQIAADAAGADNVEKTVVYIGDYVDRGLQSKDVMEILIASPLPGFKAVHLKGNHEEMLLRFLDDAQLGPDWFAIGGDATTVSYGIGRPAGLSREQRFDYVWHELHAKLPAHHLQFLRNLSLSHTVGDYVFVHAGIRPGVALDRQDPMDLMWIRGEFLAASDFDGRVIVHGHSLNDQPEIEAHRIGIDTGAYATNVLSCLVLEGTTRRFLNTGP